jgi:hypothetical protein
MEKLLNKKGGRCRQISPTRFAVAIGYDVKFIDIFRSIQDRRYDGNSRSWNFPNQHFDILLDRIKEYLSDTFGTSSTVKKSDLIGSIEITLSEENRLKVDTRKVNKNCAELEEIFRTIPSNMYDTQTKCWSFKLNDHQDLIKSIRAKFPTNLEIKDLNFSIKEAIRLIFTINLINS